MRTLVKLPASMAVSRSATRHSSELPANASMAMRVARRTDGPRMAGIRLTGSRLPLGAMQEGKTQVRSIRGGLGWRVRVRRGGGLATQAHAGTAVHRRLRQPAGGMVSGLDDAAAFHDDDAVGMLHRGQPVRDHQRGALAASAAAGPPARRVRIPHPVPMWLRPGSAPARPCTAPVRSPAAGADHPRVAWRCAPPRCRCPAAIRRPGSAGWPPPCSVRPCRGPWADPAPR